MLNTGNGVELGRFRLKTGVDEQAMRAAHAKMVRDHLASQPGWAAQYLIGLQDGSFMDFAVAVDEPHAIAICDTWYGSADCKAFLDCVEPESMVFGTVL